MKAKMLFAKNFTRIVRERELKFIDVARAMDVSPTHIHFWKEGRNAPRYDSLDALAEFLDVPVSAFFEEQTKKQA